LALRLWLPIHALTGLPIFITSSSLGGIQNT
jgi:hypothetical protein